MHMYPAETGAAIQTEPGKAIDERPDKRETPLPNLSAEVHSLPRSPLCVCVFCLLTTAAEARRRRMLLDENAASYTVVGTSDVSSASLAMPWNMSPMMVSCAAVSPILLLGARASVGKGVAVGHSQLAACGAGPYPITT
jgi:hypothetical protein